MTTIERTVSTTAPPEKVFAYLLDFRHTTEWDAGTVSCERVSGDGGPGTVYRNVSEFAGNTVELEYTVEPVERADLRHRRAQRLHDQPRHRSP